MQILKAAIIKVVSIGVFTFSVYGIFHYASISRLLLMTLIISGVTFIGDMFILPRINQAVAAIADFASLFVLYLILGNMVIGGTTNIVLPAFAAALFAGAAELFYHMYIMDRVHGETRISPPVGGLQVEIAEEIEPKDIGKINQNKDDE